MTNLTERFHEALTWAATLHEGQRRKGNQAPYVSHLLAVCSIVLDHGGGEDEAIAALLHDAIEDQGGDVTRQEIRRRFGPAVTAIVDGCSDTDVVPKPPWRARKEAYLAHLPGASPSVLLVSAADKLHNALSILRDLRDQGDHLWTQFRGGKEGSLWYYDCLVAIYQQRGPPALAADLKSVVVLIDQLARDD